MSKLTFTQKSVIYGVVKGACDALRGKQAVQNNDPRGMQAFCNGADRLESLRVDFNKKGNHMKQAKLQAMSEALCREGHFKPSWAYRFCRVSGILATGELLCQSKTRFFSQAICAVAISVAWGGIVGGSDLAIFVGSVCSLLICIALVCSISIALPRPGIPLTMTADFLHKSAQCQLHIPKRGLRAWEGIKAISDGLTCIEHLGLHRVLLSSVLIGSDSMRQGMVKRLNVEFGRQGKRWIARDDGTESWRYGYLFYYVGYRFWPWLTSLGAYRGAKVTLTEEGAHAWGKIYLERY